MVKEVMRKDNKRKEKTKEDGNGRNMNEVK